MLSEDTEHNQQEQNKNSHNLLIQGDNLEVLKHLKGAYTDKIKMIYIDPPYNTGSDGFVYQDDRSFSPEQFAELAGVDLDEAKRVLDFTQSNANSHSAWLTFIYPRLYIAKQLLKEDGVIFISIDDNEQAQLKILCDEIFGEGNFIKDLIVNTSEGGGNAKYVVNGHETILVYVRDITKFDNLKRPKDIRGKKIVIDNELYWIQEDAIREEFGKYGNLHYEDVLDKKGIAFKEKIDQGVANKEYILVPKSNGKTIIGKLRKVSEDYSKFHSILNIGCINKHLTADGIRELEELFNCAKGKSPFETPKPLELLKRIILSATFSPKKEDIVLDFFGGSGTTAHAVLNLNIEDKGNRRFICVQIDEKIEEGKEAYSMGYRSVFDITKDRIIKASEQLDQEYPESNFEHGFKIFKTCNNFLPEIKIQQLTLNFDESQRTLDAHQVHLNFTEKLVSNDFSDAQLQDILTTWKGLDKILLSENLNKITLGEYQAYGFGHVLYLVNQDFNTAALKELIKKLDDEHEFQVSKLVLLGHHFDSKSQREIDEAMKNYNNKKSIPVDVVVRY
ncbi:site-specific DNA-methyltransferase [Acinetobacter junii]|nr:site-specific DNA-methyltransferase [Acinetobacter junii]